MFDVISAQEEPVHLVCTAQLTNAALLLTLFPEIKPKIAQIVIMGGGIGIGNTSPAAEFNIE
jgi:pyrimidine-specific ribonucleoside hydrolase